MRTHLAAGVAVLVVACDDGSTENDDTTIGSGNSATESRTVAAFEAVASTGPIDVDIAVGIAETSVQVTCDDNLIGLIATEVSANTLIVSVEDEASIQSTLRCVVSVAALDLTSVQSSGSATVDVTGPLSAPSLTVTGSGGLQVSEVDAGTLELEAAGSGSLTIDSTSAETVLLTLSGSNRMVLAGTAQSGDFTLGGAGRLAALDMTLETLAVNLSDSGSAEVTVTDTVIGTVSGSGSLGVAGGADVSGVSVTESGSVTTQ